MCILGNNPSTMPSPSRHAQVSQQGYDITITINQGDTSSACETHRGEHHHSEGPRGGDNDRQDLIKMLEKFLRELRDPKGNDSDPCGRKVQQSCDDFTGSVLDSGKGEYGCGRGNQSSEAMMAALIASIIKSLKESGECSGHGKEPGQDKKPPSTDVSKLFQPSQENPGMYNILNDGPGQQKRLRETGEYMDAHPELFGKPHQGEGEQVTTWVDELTSGAMGKGTGDDLLNSEEYNKVMLASDLRSGKYEGNYNNVVFKGANGNGEINTSDMKKEDLEKLAKYMDAANAANPDNPPFPITGGSKDWMEELVTRSEGNASLDKTEMDSVTKAIASLSKGS